MKPIQAVSLWNKSFAVCNENRGDAAGLHAQWGQEWMSELLGWLAAYGPRLPQVLCVCLLRVLAGSSGGTSSTALPFPGRPGAVCVSSAGGKWGRRRGHRRQTPLEVHCPVLLFASLVPPVGAGAFYPSLAKKNSCAGTGPSADAVVSLAKDFAGMVCSLRSQPEISSRRTLRWAAFPHGCLLGDVACNWERWGWLEGKNILFTTLTNP